MISGVMSNTDLIAWATQHTSEMSSNMQGAMNDADARADELDQISKVETALETAKNAKPGDNTALANADEQLKQLLAQHPDLEGDLGDIANQIDGCLVQTLINHGSAAANDAAMKGAMATLTGSLGSDGAWSTALQAAKDRIGKEDDQGMLTIQNLNSQIQQEQQMTSNLVSSNNQTAMATIGNLRG